MEHVVNKVVGSGNNERLIITERGYTFGYNNLVVDMRGFPIMKSFGYPVVIDATHSIQLPSAGGDRSGGERAFVATIAHAAMGAGADGVFMETHEDPETALCDDPNMIAMADTPRLLARLKAIHALVRQA